MIVINTQAVKYPDTCSAWITVPPLDYYRHKVTKIRSCVGFMFGVRLLPHLQYSLLQHTLLRCIYSYPCMIYWLWKRNLGSFLILNQILFVGQTYQIYISLTDIMWHLDIFLALLTYFDFFMNYLHINVHSSEFSKLCVYFNQYFFGGFRFYENIFLHLLLNKGFK